MNTGIGADHPLWLLLLPLALLPLWRSLLPSQRFSSLTLLPADPASLWLGRLLRLLGVVAVAGTVLALAQPYLPSYEVERSGQGAEVVLLLDRSLSMDQPMGNEGRPLTTMPGGRVLGYARPMGDFKSKGKVARDVLSEFVAQRSSDRFGMVAFSSLPMRVLDFTEKQSAVQGAIAAGYVGRGLAETDIGAALLEGLSFFENRAYTGSRILLLVSDGGDHLHPDTREQLVRLMQRYKVSLYWIYLRSFGSQGLQGDVGPEEADATGASPGAAGAAAEAAAEGDALPERAMHRFFRTLGTPYRAYEAENPEDLRRAVADVNRLENLPIVYADIMPRRELGGWCIAVALACLTALAAAAGLGGSSWQ